MRLDLDGLTQATEDGRVTWSDVPPGDYIWDPYCIYEADLADWLGGRNGPVRMRLEGYAVPRYPDNDLDMTERSWQYRLEGDGELPENGSFHGAAHPLPLAISKRLEWTHEEQMESRSRVTACPHCQTPTENVTTAMMTDVPTPLGHAWLSCPGCGRSYSPVEPPMYGMDGRPLAEGASER